MKKKLLVTMLIGLLGVSTLTGCSLLNKKPTAESLYTKYITSIKDAEDMTMTYEMNLGFDISAEGVTAEMEMEAEQDIEYQKTKDGYVIYAETTAKGEILGESMEESTEMYVVVEDDEATTYQKEKGSNQWFKTSEEFKIEDLIQEIDNNFILSEETTDYEGTECYLLTQTISSKDSSYFEDTLEEQDLALKEDISIDVSLYMDVENQEPIAITYIVDLDSVNDALESELSGEEEYTIEFTEFDFKIELDKINSGLEIEIPDEVYNAFDYDANEKETTEEYEHKNDETLTTEHKPSTEEPTTEESTTEETTVSINSEGITDELVTSKTLDCLKTMGYDVNDNLVDDYYFALITNNKTVATTLSIDMIFYKNGQSVDTSTSFLTFEPGTFQVANFYMTDEAYDEVVFSIQERACHSELNGSLVDVYYNIDLENSKVYGNIENNTSDTLYFPTVHIVLFDTNGEVVGYAYGYTEENNVAPGMTSNYDFYLDCEVPFDKYIVYCNSEVDD